MKEPMGIALVGLHFGVHVLRDMLTFPVAKEHFRPVVICDQNPELLAERQREFNLPGVTSLDEALARPDVAAVALYTPPRGRAQLIKRIMEAGRHVMTTKPFERDPAAAAAVLADARRLRKIVHCNSPAPRPSKANSTLLEWQKQHDLGRAVHTTWETWADYNEKADGSWMDSEVECPAAPIFRLGVYGINELISLFGPAEESRTLAGRIRTGRPNADNGVLTLRFANGVLGTVHASFCQDETPPYRNLLMVRFERGTITRTVEPRNPDAATPEYCIRLRMTTNGRSPLVLDFDPRDNGGDYQWDVFADAIAHADTLDEENYHKAIVSGVQVLADMK